MIAVLGDTHAPKPIALFAADQSLGHHAALALESIGPKAVPALAAALLARPDSVLRARAASTLIELYRKGGNEDDILRALDRATADSAQEVRRIAVRGLGMMGPLAKPALAHLTRLLKDDPLEWVRFEAVISLSLIDASAQTVTPRLTEALKDISAGVSGAAARSLGKFGSRAKSSVPALTAALNDSRERHLPLTPDMVAARVLSAAMPPKHSA